MAQNSYESAKSDLGAIFGVVVMVVVAVILFAALPEWLSNGILSILGFGLRALPIVLRVVFYGVLLFGVIGIVYWIHQKMA